MKTLDTLLYIFIGLAVFTIMLILISVSGIFTHNTYVNVEGPQSQMTSDFYVETTTTIDYTVGKNGGF